MTRDRIVDADGHHWPVTGHRCTVCAWPLDPVNADLGTHPTCDPSRTTPMTDDQDETELRLFTREPFDEVDDPEDRRPRRGRRRATPTALLREDHR